MLVCMVCVSIMWCVCVCCVGMRGVCVCVVCVGMCGVYACYVVMCGVFE